MEEAEDVVFENSPLERHLREVGFTDFNPEKTSSFQNGKNSNTAGHDHGHAQPHEPEGIQTVGFFGFLYIKIWHYLMGTGILPSLRSSLYQRLVSGYIEEYVAVILESNILCEEDALFLEKFDPQLFNFKEKERCLQKGSSKEQNVLTELTVNFLNLIHGHTYILLTALVCSAAVFAGYNRNCIDNLTLQSLIVVSVLVLMFVSLWSQVYAFFSLRSCHCKNLSLLKKYCSEVKMCSSLLRKSVLIIQEMELICRGYTLVGPGMPTRVLQHATDKDIQHKIFPALRGAICETTRNIIVSIRKATNSIVQNLPLCPEINNVFSYLASVSLDDIFMDLGDDKLGGFEATGHDVDMSLHSLKVLCSVATLFQSGFLSRLLVSLSSKSCETESRMHLEVCRKTGNIIQEPLENIIKLHSSLKRSYHFHQSTVTEPQSAPRSNRPADNRQYDKWSGLYNATHSLELHLQSALMRLGSIQETLDELVSADNGSTNSELVNTSFNNLEINYTGVKHNLESAKCCWEEGTKRLQLIIGKADSDTTGSPQTDYQDVQAQTPQFLEHKIVNIDDIIEEEDDQIFEGYTDSFEEVNADQPSLSAEALEKEKQQLEESRHLMVELRCVLANKVKDPLVTNAGFVLPAGHRNLEKEEVSLPCKPIKVDSGIPFEERQHRLNEKRVDLLNSEDSSEESTAEFQFDLQNSKTTTKTAEPCSNSRESVAVRTNRCIGHLESVEDEEEEKNTAKHLNLQSSFAFSIAAAAAARSRTIGVQEETFEESDSE